MFRNDCSQNKLDQCLSSDLTDHQQILGVWNYNDTGYTASLSFLRVSWLCTQVHGRERARNRWASGWTSGPSSLSQQRQTGGNPSIILTPSEPRGQF